VVDVRLDHKATAISLLVVLGVRMVRRCCFAVKAVGGDSSDAWRALSTI
jgi:putative transposase